MTPDEQLEELAKAIDPQAFDGKEDGTTIWQRVKSERREQAKFQASKVLSNLNRQGCVIAKGEEE
ncbi:MAG: hypothetical protein NXI13_13930 [Proteobacteria bacterium]|nr:hypothetical protein [Pseudomonadota bacterium]